jgi:hypothetical protein
MAAKCRMVPCGITGSPTITPPNHIDRDGMPVVGRHVSEVLLARARHAYRFTTDCYTCCLPDLA